MRPTAKARRGDRWGPGGGERSRQRRGDGRTGRGGERARQRRHVLRQERDSFGHAFQGVAHAWATQRHLRIHVALALFAFVLGLILRLAPVEWAVLCLTVAVVLALELLNTVVEAVVDLASPEYHSLAKVAKDVAAGAVLVASCGGLGVGTCLFLPKLWALVRP